MTCHPVAVVPPLGEHGRAGVPRWSALLDESQRLSTGGWLSSAGQACPGRGSRAALVVSSRGVPTLRGGSGCGAAPRRCLVAQVRGGVAGGQAVARQNSWHRG